MSVKLLGNAQMIQAGSNLGAGALDAGIVHLLGASMTLNNFTARTALLANEAAFSGYAAFVLPGVMPAVFAQPDGSVLCPIPLAIYTTDGITPGTVYGFWIETVSSQVVVMGIFNTPILMSVAGEGLTLQVNMIVPANCPVTASTNGVPN